ncbi:hypothetical protein [Streptomyces incanus]|uniref:Uncharacterized protein n=1 Tax=Streptomyces incanus TaxID=887453 RepID=A0ABW0Y1K9_9ACTN
MASALGAPGWRRPAAGAAAEHLRAAYQAATRPHRPALSHRHPAARGRAGGFAEGSRGRLVGEAET